MLKFGNYGQDRDLICTEEEREIFEIVSAEFPGEDLQLVRVSDNYVTIRRGVWDIVRLKYTNRAKWLMFPVVEAKQEKHCIERPAEVENYVGIIRDSLDHADKYE